jgi:hypothetical protein
MSLQGVIMRPIKIFTAIICLSALAACEMTENAVSSSASGFASSQINPVVSNTETAFMSSTSSAGTSVGSGF